MDNKDTCKVAIEIAKTAKEVLPQTVVETDGAISTIVGWFNNVVLYPVKKANITYQYKLECFSADLQERVETIPLECLCEPNIMIAGPTLEALKYTYDEEKLRNMYVNLLSSSMDSRKNKLIHPSFVNIIKQMDSLDAKLFQELSKRIGHIYAINPIISIVDRRENLFGATPEWFIDYIPQGYDIFQVSASLIRLEKLGIIQLMYGRAPEDDSYEKLLENPLLRQILNSYKLKKPMTNLYMTKTNSVLYVNEVGQQFALSCLD